VPIVTKAIVPLSPPNVIQPDVINRSVVFTDLFNAAEVLDDTSNDNPQSISSNQHKNNDIINKLRAIQQDLQFKYETIQEDQAQPLKAEPVSDIHIHQQFDTKLAPTNAILYEPDPILLNVKEEFHLLLSSYSRSKRYKSQVLLDQERHLKALRQANDEFNEINRIEQTKQ